MVNSYIQKLCWWWRVGVQTTASLVALTAWAPLQVAAATEAAVQAVLVGQAYGPDFVVLQPEGADAGRTLKSPSNRAPPKLRLAALHAAGAALLPPDALVRWQAPLPPLRPQRLAQQGSAEWVAKCPDVPAAGLPAVGALPKPVPHSDFVDWFDPDFPDNCETDEGLAHYTGLAGLTAGMPVLAYAGFGGLKADYTQAGQARPLNAKEKLSVRAYVAAWRKDFKRIYRVPFNAEDNPTGPIRTLADAEIFVVMRDEQGQAVLRVSMWKRISVGQHQYMLMVVDRLENNRVRKTWTFGRAQGVMG
jgi:hypothetical protein